MRRSKRCSETVMKTAPTLMLARCELERWHDDPLCVWRGYTWVTGRPETFGKDIT